MEIKDNDNINSPQINLTEPVLKKKNNFKKKKSNSYLRNNKNSHNQQNSKRNENLPDDEPESTTYSSEPKPIYNELFYLLRQKYTHNTANFFLELEKNLLEIDFHLIQYDGMSLFSYAAIYEKNDIFFTLIDRYSDKMKKEDFEKYIIPTCLNKNIELLSLSINTFNSKFELEPLFLENLFLIMSKSSYRETNNTIILDWIENKISPEQIDKLLTYSIQNKNLSLIDSILKYDNLNKHLKNNFNNFVSILEKIGKRNEIEQKIKIFPAKELIAPLKVTQETIAVEKEVKTYLGDNDEQLKNLNNDFVPNIIVKKKKKVIS